ncbi:MAG: discoidin domain-containing protein [Dehalococcoidales bacterium]|nr:discoidin domain-containing protein [Dehalococcoidales bacterium]
MDSEERTNIRKRPFSERQRKPARDPGTIDLAAEAFVFYTSEDPDHPIENAFDAEGGRGGTRWEAAEADTPQIIELEFDEPQFVSRIVYEVEEEQAERTQEIRIEASADEGDSYGHVLVQEYNFSPGGATFEREDWRLDLKGVTNLRLTLIPNKRGSGKAKITTLHVYD